MISIHSLGTGEGVPVSTLRQKTGGKTVYIRMGRIGALTKETKGVRIRKKLT